MSVVIGGAAEVLTFVMGAATVATVLPKNADNQEERGNKSVKSLSTSIVEAATLVFTQPSLGLGLVEMSKREANKTEQVQIKERRKLAEREESHGQCPSKGQLEKCLEHNVFTNVLHFKQEGILHKTAKVFADSKPTPLSIRKGVLRVVSESVETGALSNIGSEMTTALLLELGVKSCCHVYPGV